MIVYIDIDNTICTTEGNDYENAKPIKPRITMVNILKSGGYKVVMCTARGSGTGKPWKDMTARQLKEWGVQYDELVQKPYYDLLIDDKASFPELLDLGMNEIVRVMLEDE